MLRHLCCFAPKSKGEALALSTALQGKRKNKKTPKPAPGAPADHLAHNSPTHRTGENDAPATAPANGIAAPSAPATAPPPEATASEACAAALRALGDIATTPIADPRVSDLERARLLLAALDACVPWFGSGRDVHAAIGEHLQSFADAPLNPASAGALAAACQGAAIVAMQRPARIPGRGEGKANASLVTAVGVPLQELPCMQPYQRLLTAGLEATLGAVDRGRAAAHDSLFDCYMGLVSDVAPPPSLDEIAFLQQALVALGGIDIQAIYRLRHPQPLIAVGPPNAEITDPDAQAAAQAVHHYIQHFVAYGGGMNCAPNLCWCIEQALSRAGTEPHIVDAMFQPRAWKYKDVRAPKQSNLPMDTTAHLLGAMYHSVLRFISGAPGMGWRKQGQRPAIAVESHRDFLTYTFTALYRAGTTMPASWIPPQQWRELHEITLDGVAQDCDGYTLRGRIEAFVSNAGASPSLEALHAEEAANIADSWEHFKSRLYSEEMPLQRPSRTATPGPNA